MKKLCLGVAILLSLVGLVWAQAVTVYDVGVEPDSLNKKVTVSYRLNSTSAPVANVAIEISSDAGDSWVVPADTFYPGSDIGPGIPADGTLREFVWDARTDWNQQYSTQMIIRLDATAEEMQNGLFFTAGPTLYRMNLDGSACTALYTGLPKNEQLLMDYENNMLLLVSWYSGSQILGYDVLQGGTPSLLYDGPGISGGMGIALDSATSQLFLGLYYNGVYRTDVQTVLGWECIVPSAAISPMIGQRGQLQVDPVSEQVYFRSAFNGWCDECRWIWRVNYDGTGLTQIIQANGGDALALNLPAGKMIFSDGGEVTTTVGTVNRANLDGTGLETILELPLPYNHCTQLELDLSANKMYLYLTGSANSWQNQAIARANLDGTDYEMLKEVLDANEGRGLALFIR
jgi:hypothetical protein